MLDLIDNVENFLRVYIDDSTIKTITYANGNEEWTIVFQDELKLTFKSFKEMFEWLHAEQYGG